MSIAPDFATFEIEGLHDELLVSSFECTEGISELYVASVEVACLAELTLPQVSRRPGALCLRGLSGERHVHGIVSRLEFVRAGPLYRTYRVDVVPRLWLLSLRQDFRVFQNATAPEIVKDVLDRAGLGAQDFELSLSREYRAREYCTQYRERDLAFLERVLAEEGIFYFFVHSRSGHLLKLADHPAAHARAPGLEQGLMLAPGSRTSREAITAISMHEELRPSRVSVRDFAPLCSRPRVCVGGGASDSADEVYMYPASRLAEGVALPDALIESLGGAASGLRLSALQAGGKGVAGQSDCSALAPGFTVALATMPASELEGDQIVSRVVHEGRQPGVSQVEARGRFSYTNRFECLGRGSPAPAPARGPAPTVPGIQTAIVTGPPGERVHTDEHGRIKVQFHWDREGRGDERSSCWVRVAQPWMGSGHGTMFIPRVGDEVVVGFLEGDPDRPIVLGSLCNAAVRPPYALPEHKTRTVLRTESTLGGEGHCELCVDDRRGQEGMFVIVTRDLDVSVGADQRTTVRGERHETVIGERRTSVGCEHVIVEQSRRVRVGGDSYEAVAGAQQLRAGSLSLVAGRLTIAAEQVLTLSVAGATITLDERGVHIDGPTVRLNCGGARADVKDVSDGGAPERPAPAEEP